jgi:hypothetical protein
MAYRREHWFVSSVSEVKIMWNITPCPPPLLPQQHQTSLGHIGTGPRDAMAPSAITWAPIYGRLGTRRLGTVILCISFVD